MSAFVNKLLFSIAFDPPQNSWYNTKTDVVWLPTKECKIAARLIQPCESNSAFKDAVVLFSHGNAENIGADSRGCYEYCRNLANELKIPVICYDYVGYDKFSADDHQITTETNLHSSIQAVYDYLQAQKFTKIIVVGKSIGSIPSVWLTAQTTNNLIKSLILISPLASGYSTLSISKYTGQIGILDQIFGNNLSLMSQIQVPTLFFHGKQDEIVDMRNTILLHDNLRSPWNLEKPILWGTLNHPIGHNNIETEHYTDFIDRIERHISYSFNFFSKEK